MKARRAGWNTRLKALLPMPYRICRAGSRWHDDLGVFYASGHDAWKAADRDHNTDWRSTELMPNWWRADLAAPQTVLTYTMRASQNKEEYAPKDWTLSGATNIVGPYTVSRYANWLQMGQRAEAAIYRADAGQLSVLPN